MEVARYPPSVRFVIILHLYLDLIVHIAQPLLLALQSPSFMTVSATAAGHLDP
jgi:hypothetical protein